jgi:ankyrin repeat protein
MEARPGVTEQMIIAACERGHISQLRQLGRQGVRVVSKEPLAVAVGRGLVDVLRCLVNDFGANVEERLEGCPLLVFAALRGHVAVVECLVNEFGVDVNQRDRSGWTSVFTAAQQGHTSVVQCLIKEFGADIT